MPTKFPGFTKESLSFFRQLAKNNDRDWFTPRKDVYQEKCVAPMLQLVAAVNERLAKIAVEYVVPEPKRAIYRLYRDTRFSKDKTPYKTHIAAYFQRKGYARHRGPGFYVQISPAGVGIAGGIYMVEPDEIKAIRTAIAADPKGFDKVACGKKLTAALGPLKGDSLKRPPKGFETPDNPHVRMKQWYYWHETDPAEALTPALPKLITTQIELMLPMCEWLHEVLAAATAQDNENKPKRPAPMF